MPAHGTHGALGLSESCMSRAAGGRGWGRRGAGTRRGRRWGSMAMAPDGRSLGRRSGGCHERKRPALPLHRITRCHCQLRARRRPREGRERAALLPRALPAATMSTPERVGRHSALPCRAQLQAADAHSTFLKRIRVASSCAVSQPRSSGPLPFRLRSIRARKHARPRVLAWIPDDGHIRARHSRHAPLTQLSRGTAGGVR